MKHSHRNNAIRREIRYDAPQTDKMTIDLQMDEQRLRRQDTWGTQVENLMKLWR